MDDENAVTTTAVIPLGTYEGVEISARPGDQYVNATAMCQATGKLWAHYRENRTTREFLEALESSIGIPIDELIISRPGQPVNGGGTWVHRRVALHLAQWCSSEFAVWVTARIEELLLNGSAREHDEAAIARIYGDRLAAVLCGMENKIDLLSVGYDEHQRDIVRHDAHLVQHDEDIAGLKEDVNGFKHVLGHDAIKNPPAFSVQTFQGHVNRIYHCCECKCPGCGVVQIVNLKGQVLRGLCKEDYFYSPTDNSPENTWLVCFACHVRLEDDKDFHKEMCKRFEEYQAMRVPDNIQHSFAD